MRVLAPYPWTEFTVTAKPGRSDIIAMVNRIVNAGIRPASGKPQASDQWKIWPPIGWCHDYALTKLEELKLRGIQSQLCECIAPDGEYHMVTIVDGLVLDNLTPTIGVMRYPVVATQSLENPDIWENLS